jgi:LacI family transcriptional regulator
MRVNEKAATIYDIAKLAGVNPSTVSRALTTPGRINAATEAKVREAAKQLNYRVNPFARALPTGKTKMIALMVADITNPVFFKVVRGAEIVAAECASRVVS